MIKRLVLDFETRSKCDLKKRGAHVYSLDPSTQPTCLAFKIRGDTRIYFLDFAAINRRWAHQPEALRKLWQRLIDEEYEFTCHNAMFEKVIYENILVKRYGWPRIPFAQYRCTAAKAAACALPRSLAGAGEAMGLHIQKDLNGHIAMMRTCKPTAQYRAWLKAHEERDAGKRIGHKKLKLASSVAPKMFLDLEDDPQTWHTLYEYCKIDVIAEEELDQSLPDLSPFEQEIWHLNQELNWRGLRCDLPLINKILHLLSEDKQKRLKELDTLTMGLVTSPHARKSILDFLELEGVKLENLRAKTVEDQLQDFDTNENAKLLLEIRQALSKTSTKKYQAFVDRTSHDDRVRDVLLYHGASTGRDSGVGVQFQNLPRPLIGQRAIEQVIGELKTGRPDVLENLAWLYGSPSMVFSSLIRSMLIPSAGHELFVADFAKIEVAVLWWLAGNSAGLKILTDGLDPYIYMASANTGKSYEEIEQALARGETWAIEARQLGKAQTLGCGFGLGPRKFQTTAWDFYRLKLSLKDSRKAVAVYREANSAVPQMWQDYEEACVAAVENTGTGFSANRCRFIFKNHFLWITLPSGRRLAYRNPEVNWRVREYEEVEEIEHPDGTVTTTVTKRITEPLKTLEYMAVNSKTKKWSLERNWGGGITENVVQAVARDLMMGAILRLDRAGFKALLTVHDEAICEASIGTKSLDDFNRLMCHKPKWAEGLPLEAKGWTGPRYKKG